MRRITFIDIHFSIYSSKNLEEYKLFESELRQQINQMLREIEKKTGSSPNNLKVHVAI